MTIFADPPPILHSMLGLQDDESGSPLWVKSRRTGAPPGRSAPGGEADEIGAKADIADAISGAGGITDLTLDMLRRSGCSQEATFEPDARRAPTLSR